MTVSLNDIKFDLLKIIEPWDGLLSEGKSSPVRRLFVTYLNDLQKDRSIADFAIDTSNRENAVTFDINIRMAIGRSPKKLKIHVGTYQHPWCNA